MKESDLKKQVTDFLKIKMQMGELWYFATHGKLGNLIPDRAGLPDIVGIFKGGQGFGIELKAPGKKPTEAQLYELGRIFEMEGVVMWADDFDEVVKFVEENT